MVPFKKWPKKMYTLNVYAGNTVKIASKFHLDTCNTPPLTFFPGFWHVSLEYKKMTSKASLENEKKEENEAIAGKFAKNR